MSIIRDSSLAANGQAKIDWVKNYMPILEEIERKYAPLQPLKGKKLAVSVHLEAKTARLCLLLKALGAQVAATGSNPLSTRDDIAAALAANGIEVFAWYNATPEEYKDHLIKTLSFGPDIIIDDGGDFLGLLHGELAHLSDNIIGGCEETTTGVHRMKARERDGLLKFPMINVNDAQCKHLFDNRFGTGESTLTAIMNTTNLVLSGKNVVVAGYGHCGEGIAEKAKGLGAHVIITEINPVRALEATMCGFTVMTMEEAAKVGDVFITVTGCCDIITREHFMLMKNGAIMSNSGHFDCEIDVAYLDETAVKKAILRDNIVGYTLQNGKQICVLAEGRLVNLGAGLGHPAEIMDMSFAIQTMGVLYLIENKGQLKPCVYDISDEIDLRVAELKLKTMGLNIDVLSQKQRDYLNASEV